MDIWQVLQAASVIIALGSFAGLALQRGVVVGLREQVGDSKTRIEFLEKERTEDKTLIATQSSDIAALQKVVTGEVHWLAISDLLEHHHRDSVEHWRDTKHLLTEIRDRDLK